MIDSNNYEEYLDALDATYGFACGFKNHLKDLTRKLAKLRDLGDDLVKSFNFFLSKSRCTSSEFQKRYCQLSQCFSIVEDNRDAKIERLDTRLSKSFELFLDFLKSTRAKYKRLINSYKKELNQQCKNFDQGVNCTETSDMINLKLEMKKLIENFEKQKVETFDKIFKDYLLIQLSFCTQATQVYSNGYKSLNSSVDDVFNKNIAEMTKSLYQHNFESALLDLTTSFDQLDTSTKSNSPKFNSKKILDLSGASVLSVSSNGLNKTKDIRTINSSNSIFGMIKLINEDSDDVLFDKNSTTENSSEEEDSYETKKRKKRLEFLHKLTETEV